MSYAMTDDWADTSKEDRSRIAELEEICRAFMDGWEVEKRSLYDEEGVEGWAWTSPDGLGEFTVIGGWDELPPWPGPLASSSARTSSSAGGGGSYFPTGPLNTKRGQEKK